LTALATRSFEMADPLLSGGAYVPKAGGMMKSMLRIWLPTGLITLFLVVGCSDPGPAEQAGERVDDAVEETREAVEDAVQELEDAVDPPGPAERAGRAIDDAVEGAGDRTD
jgi:hypothetical protein